MDTLKVPHLKKSEMNIIKEIFPKQLQVITIGSVVTIQIKRSDEGNCIKPLVQVVQIPMAIEK